jgi:hypothetical protein
MKVSISETLSRDQLLDKIEKAAHDYESVKMGQQSNIQPSAISREPISIRSQIEHRWNIAHVDTGTPSIY